MRILAGGLAGLLLWALLSVPPVQAAPQFWETTVLVDPEGDYSASGVLDITAVHVSEVYRHDLDKGTGIDVVQFRIDLRNREDLSNLGGQAGVDFTLNFTVTPFPQATGFSASVNVTLRQSCRAALPGTQDLGGLKCEPPTVPSPHYTNASGLTIVMDAKAWFLVRGAKITDIYVTSAVVDSTGRKTYHDQAPFDNQQRPEGEKIVAPETKGRLEGSLRGPYPFLQIGALSPVRRYAVPGGEARFSVRFTLHEKLTGVDQILVDFKTPAQWSVDTNLGRSIVLRDGAKQATLTFTVKVPRGLEEGARGDVLLDAVLPKAGGHATMRATVDVSGPRVSMPEYDFQLLTKGPFRVGEATTLRFSIKENQAPLAPSDVRVEFLQAGQSKATATLKSVGAGAYETTYDFPAPGMWTLDPYIVELTPSPHKTFEVTAEKAGGDASGAHILATLLTMFVAGVWVRRR